MVISDSVAVDAANKTQFKSYESCCPGRDQKNFWEKLSKYIFPKNTEMVVFDIGMNVGYFGVTLMSTWPGLKKYYGFEPFEANVEIAKKKITGKARKNKIPTDRFTFVSMPVTDVSQDQPLYQGIAAAKAGSQHFTLHPHRNQTSKAGGSKSKYYPAEANTIVKTVRTTTLDDYVKDNGIKHIDFLKMDTEGNEPLVFQGAHYTLSTLRPPVIYFECHRFWRDNYEIPYSVKWVSKLLRTYGYDMFYINSEELIFTDEPFYSPLYDANLGWRNCLAISHDAPRKVEFLSKANGNPHVADGVLPYLIQPASDTCRGAPVAMPPKPLASEDPVKALPKGVAEHYAAKKQQFRNQQRLKRLR